MSHCSSDEVLKKGDVFTTYHYVLIVSPDHHNRPVSLLVFNPIRGNYVVSHPQRSQIVVVFSVMTTSNALSDCPYVMHKNTHFKLVIS